MLEKIKSWNTNEGNENLIFILNFILISNWFETFIFNKIESFCGAFQYIIYSIYLVSSSIIHPLYQV